LCFIPTDSPSLFTRRFTIGNEAFECIQFA
jgi:hypothetical protein